MMPHACLASGYPSYDTESNKRAGDPDHGPYLEQGGDGLEDDALRLPGYPSYDTVPYKRAGDPDHGPYLEQGGDGPEYDALRLPSYRLPGELTCPM